MKVPIPAEDRTASPDQDRRTRGSNVVTGPMLSVIPLVVAIVILQRFWRGGLTEGAIKG